VLILRSCDIPYGMSTWQYGLGLYWDTHIHVIYLDLLIGYYYTLYYEWWSHGLISLSDPTAQGDEWRHPVDCNGRASTDRFIMVNLMNRFWAWSLELDSVDSFDSIDQMRMCVGPSNKIQKNVHLDMSKHKAHIYELCLTSETTLNACQ
jgi:hypothetical protein